MYLYSARSVVSLGNYSQPERSGDCTLILSSGLHINEVHGRASVGHVNLKQPKSDA